MKNNFALHLFVAFTLIAFATDQASADLISPTLPILPRTAKVAAAPSGPATVRLVTNTRDDGPGSLRNAISNAVAGDTIRFAIGSANAGVIQIKSTLVIDKDLRILGPGPLRIAVVRSLAKNTPSFTVFNVDDGAVTISGLTVANGRALNPDGKSDNLGGGIRNFATLTISNCIFTRNEAQTEAGGVGFGGGIFSFGALTLLDSNFDDNEVSGAGGGVSTFHCPNFRAERCTFSDNFAKVQGGGISFQGSLGHIKNCTISDNRSVKNGGAASALLHLVFPGEASGLDISACTITENHGDTNGAVIVAALSGSLGIVTRMIGTLVAENEPQNFLLVNANVQSLGHNLDSDGSSGFVNGAIGDIVGTPTNPIDARLGPLSYNGGLTLTHALRHGSPAIDSGSCVDTEGVALATDQRGVPRPQGLSCDIGAFEFVANSDHHGHDDDEDEDNGDDDDQD